MKMNDVHKKIDNYYTGKIEKYGATPQGVDWNGEESQFTRFKQLSKIFNKKNFTINDVGCGYGKYLEFLNSHDNSFEYYGYDLSNSMIDTAKKLYGDKFFTHVSSLEEMQEVDFSIASGIFSVKMECSETEWLTYILNTLDIINEKSISGFSFNMLTKYSDKEHMQKNLYYADPLFMFDYCKRNYSKQISLLHDYGLYEFTILVRKEL